ncbi:MAG: hypothetical protein CMJ96_00490 [Planctomycetes bacterium]|nr:hypothetical protein [Planctomycetota bacterium]
MIFFIVVALTGILAAYLHLVMGQWANRIGLPRLDFSRVMANACYDESFEGESSYWAGQIAVYFNGVFFAFLYATVIGPHLPGEPAVRGLIYGFILYLGPGLFFIPVYLKEGVFLSHVDKKAWLPLLMVHLIFGLVVGWLSPILGVACTVS